MAGDWIKIRKDLPEDPSTIGMSESLGITPDEAVGMLVRFWRWVDSHVGESNALGVTKITVDRLMHVTGFANALLNVGWLEEISGELFVPHRDRHLSKSAKQRALTAVRQAKFRNARVTLDALPEKRREDDDDDIPSGMSSQRQPKRRRDDTPKAEEVKTAWNELAARHGLSQVSRLSATRLKAARARLRENPELWQRLESALSERGAWARDRGFPNFDQTMRPAILDRLLEGSYRDNGTGATTDADTERKVRIAMEMQRRREGENAVE